jgi:hypothetical protein
MCVLYVDVSFQGADVPIHDMDLQRLESNARFDGSLLNVFDAMQLIELCDGWMDGMD